MLILVQAMLATLVIPSAGNASARTDYVQSIEQRKDAFLARRIAEWQSAGFPIEWKHEEWKFDEVEPNWTGALAAMYLKRSPEEVAQANAFFEAMPLDRKIDPDMRICEILHSYYLFRDDPELTPAARKHLLELIRFEPPPRRINSSIWQFGATENHALMGHVWCLLAAQLDRDRRTAAEIGRHIESYVVEHIRKGWAEYNSPCYVEKEIGCLIMLSEWAEDPVLRRKAELGLDVLLAEHALLNLEGTIAGPACRVYRPEFNGILPEELGHNSRYDARCHGSYCVMHILFGLGGPHFYGVLGAPLVATSRYVPPQAVYALAAAGPSRGSYEFKARRPGNGIQALRRPLPPGKESPEPFNGRVYAWVTPAYVLGSFQEVQGQYSALRSLPVTSVLRMAGDPRRIIHTDFMLGGRQEMAAAVADCVQYKNVSIGRGSVGRAYLSTRRFDELAERGRWVFVRAEGTFAAYGVIGTDFSWARSRDPGLYGDFITYDAAAPFVLEAASAEDYDGQFARFQDDVLDNDVEFSAEGVSYQSCSRGRSGPSAEPFALRLRYGELPLLNGSPIDLAGYPTFDSPYLNSAWDSGIVKLDFGPDLLTINVARERAIRIEEHIAPLSLPYRTDCEQADPAWVPFLNYWRLKPEQWYWDEGGGADGGCLRHDAARGVQDSRRGAHDAMIILRGGERWTDYSFEADVYADKGTAGLWVRADMQDEGGGNGRSVKGYLFVVDPKRRVCRLWRARQDGRVIVDDAGRPAEIEKNHFSNPLAIQQAAAPETVAPRRWLAVQVEVRKNVITCSVDGRRVIQAEDDLYPSGSIGCFAYKGNDTRFDDIRVTPLP